MLIQRHLSAEIHALPLKFIELKPRKLPVTSNLEVCKILRCSFEIHKSEKETVDPKAPESQDSFEAHSRPAASSQAREDMERNSKQMQIKQKGN